MLFAEQLLIMPLLTRVFIIFIFVIDIFIYLFLAASDLHVLNVLSVVAEGCSAVVGETFTGVASFVVVCRL